MPMWLKCRFQQQNCVYFDDYVLLHHMFRKNLLQTRANNKKKALFAPILDLEMLSQNTEIMFLQCIFHNFLFDFAVPYITLSALAGTADSSSSSCRVSCVCCAAGCPVRWGSNQRSSVRHSPRRRRDRLARGRPHPQVSSWFLVLGSWTE